MGRLRVVSVPTSYADHVRGLWALAGPADLERPFRRRGRCRRARLAGRHYLAERPTLGTGRRLFALRLARHRPGVGPGRERGGLDPKSCCTCWMVRPALARDQATKRSRRRVPGNVRGLGLRAVYAIRKRSPRRLAAVLLARRAFRSDVRRTPPRKATQIPGRSSPAARSPVGRRPPACHNDPPGATRPSPKDAPSDAPAYLALSASVPTPRG